MGVVDFTPENKGATGGPSFPQLILERKGDVARIVALEQPHAGFVHTIKAPVLLNGLPKMETRTRKDGSTFEDYAMDFVGRPFCLGDEGILLERGMDPEHCPVCRAVKDYSEWFAKPDRRFAMHVIVYSTQPGTTVLNHPYNVSVKVWAFTERVFGQLVDLAGEFAQPGQKPDLRIIDIKLTCSNPTFRQYDIQGLPKAEWRADQNRMNLTVETFKGQRAADIEELIGRKAVASKVQDDVDLVVAKWNQALARQPMTPLADDLSSTGPVDFDALLGGPAGPAAIATASAAVGVPDISLLLGESPAQPAQPAKAAAPASTSNGDTFDFAEFAPIDTAPAQPAPADLVAARSAPKQDDAGALAALLTATPAPEPTRQPVAAGPGAGAPSIDDLLAGL